MDEERLERVASPSCMSQLQFNSSAEVTPSKEAIVTGRSTDSDDVDAFGPPPAFPQNNSVGKRKLTLMSVSTASGFRVGEDANSDDESSSIDNVANCSQLVHRIKGGASSDQSSTGSSPSSEKEDEDADEGRGQKRTHDDAMVLASLSDVGSPEGASGSDDDDGKCQEGKQDFDATPKSNHTTSSTAGTPLRSNVNPSSDGVKPFALLPKPYTHKRGKLVHDSGEKKEPQDERAPPSFTGQYGGYPYHHPHGHGHPPPPPPPPHPSPYAGYPYAFPHPPPPPPGSMPPSAYYGMHGHGPPTPMPPTPEYWGQYHSPEHMAETIDPVRSGAPPFHPLSSPVRSSHVVPTDESEQLKPGHPQSAPPRGPSYSGPPPPGYPGYYPPPSIEYKRSFTVSVDESSPSRQHPSETSPGAPRPRPEMHLSSSSPPRPGPHPGHHPESPYPGYPPQYPSGGESYQPHEYPSASSSIQYPPPHMGNYQFRKGGRTIHSEPIMLKKKFSWRNYPELEEFLIANRTEYLRHSALNYTAEQKHFNNRLTEGLLEIAARHNYVFDESCFNFVAVRDRIRCYYKSYVQSSKKRGILVGYSKTKSQQANNEE